MTQTHTHLLWCLMLVCVCLLPLLWLWLCVFVCFAMLLSSRFCALALAVCLVRALLNNDESHQLA
jgi:hypothetical protein